jgi:hypothetical protein
MISELSPLPKPKEFDNAEKKPFSPPLPQPATKASIPNPTAKRAALLFIRYLLYTPNREHIPSHGNQKP